MKNILGFYIIFILLLSTILTLTLSKRRKDVSDYQEQIKLKELSVYQEERSLSKIIPHRMSSSDQSSPYETSNYLKLVTGMGIGFGLTVDANEDLKNCFVHKEHHNQIINKFLSQTNKLDRKELSENENKQKLQNTTKSFTEEVISFFSNFNDCAPFKETFFSFIRNRIINIGVKGIAYAAGGVIGLLIKSSYDMFKLLSEIRNFYIVRNQRPVDYFNLGSSVGKIVYYTQNLIIKKRK